ncbi:type IV pilin protein [Marinobacter sp. ATCH36]|uniref:type IV pilin protein n=1 Tax=Marinobacter sp. ATCH36 TaxID=2945106 RepID=UPI00201FF739|nr:type IV pilin protein [Marinobacter sp. ATCH36]MCL7945874.1 type IV pilin protein [Marinobacter sp. ATCH36]
MIYKLNASSSSRNSAGFTLIELMIVVAIIGIIAAIAYPSYRNNVMATHRANAQADLMSLAQWMERKYVQQNYSYEDGGSAPTLPQTRSPQDGAKMYDLTVATPSRNEFTLTATPAGGQTDDKCGTLTLNQAGAKTATKGGSAVNDCW